MRTVQAIARALNVKLQEFFLPVRQLQTVRFRSAKSMQNRKNILANVARWLDDFSYLEKILKDEIPLSLKQISNRCSKDNIPEIAKLCREKLELKSDEPIHDISGLLEHAGVKVRSILMASDSFFGLSVGEKDGGPAIVVNVGKRISVERRIFSAAHELGHIMLHPKAFDVTKTKENKKEEREANLFAGHFLMPDEGFRKEWNAASGLHFIDRIFKIKRIFRVSYKTVISRLLDYKVVKKGIWKDFNYQFQRRFNKKLLHKNEPLGIDPAEPYGLRQFDFYQDRFSRLTREALENELISLSRGAEILDIGIAEMQDLQQNWGGII